LSALVLVFSADDPSPFVLGGISLAVQSTDKGRFSFREGRHLLANHLEQLVFVIPRSQGQVLARALLQFGVEDVTISLKDVDQLRLDLRE